MIDALRARLYSLAERRLLWAVLVGYVALRTVSAFFILLVADRQGPEGITGGPDNGHSAGYWDVTRAWDGHWYQTIATQGYPDHVPRDEHGTPQQNPLAFYPLYPMAVRALMAVTGGSFSVVGSLLALAVGAVAAVLMAQLLRPRIGAYASWWAVMVLMASPPSPVFQMTYTESTALALVLGFVLALDRERWLAAGWVALLIGTARPVAVPLGLAALAVCVARWRRRERDPVPTYERLEMLFVLLACGVSALVWPMTTWFLTGEGDAYESTMASWRGSQVIEPFMPWVNNFRYLFGGWGLLVLVVLVAAYVALMVGPWAARLGVAMRAWTLAYGFYLLAVLDVWTSTYRYLLFAFPVAVVLIGAGWRAPERRTLLGVRGAVWVVLGLAWQLWWCLELLVIVPPDNPI